jgi:hypothetical protein
MQILSARPSIEEYLLKRLMPVEGIGAHIYGI